MTQIFDFEKAREILEGGTQKAQELLQDAPSMDELLKQLEVKLSQIPAAGPFLADIPLMVAMVKSYITREYSVVSPKVIALLVSAFIYIVKKDDMIDDKNPVIGYLDDLAITAVAISLAKPELAEFAKWREENSTIA